MTSNRLENVLRWLQTAKENLPDLNNGVVAADRISAASALIDRMHRVAKALEGATGSSSSLDADRHQAHHQARRAA
jgi:hypothetical protein